MLGVIIGETLPIALGIAISPFPIIAAILMLLSPNSRRTGPGFLLGWVAGIALATVAFVLLGSALPAHADSAGPNLLRAIIQFLLFALLMLLAVRQWRHRPRPGEEPTLPGWMAAIDSFTFARALGLGLLLSAANPKNLLIAASAGVTIGGAGLDLVSEVAATGVFILCATATVWVPVVAFLLASRRLAGPLEAVRGWLLRENSTVMTVLLLFMGVLMLGKAIASL